MASSFNTERLKLTDATRQLQNQIDSLKEDLARYRAKPGASEKYGFFKDQQIKTLEAVAESFTEYAESTTSIYSDQIKEIASLKTKVFVLEGVSLLHGITNFRYYLRMPLRQLVELVKRAYTDNWRQTPIDLLPDPDHKHDPEYRRLTKSAQNLIHGKEKNKR